jgi:long-chain acyl-CoA synthetase
MDTTTIERSQVPTFVGSHIIGSREAGTLWGLFCLRVERSPDNVAYRDYDSVTESWREHTWRAIAARVDRFRCALAQEGLNAGDRIAIQLANGIDWVCLDLAAHASGLVVVGLYPRDTAASNAYILGHSGARLILLDTEARWRELRAYRSEFPLLGRVWLRGSDVASVSETTDPIVRGLVDVLAIKSESVLSHPAAPSDLATLIYTSGTTGRPKGVMLSHHALLWNAEAAASIITPRSDDVFLSILPLSHAFERTVGYYLPIMGGCTVAFARSAHDLREDLVMVHPTALLGVPRLFELMADAIAASVAKNYIKRNVLRLAAAIGWRRFEATRQRRDLDFITRLLWPLLQRYVVTPVLAAFGGRLRVAISGGAPLDQGVTRLMIGLGLPLVEGYGLTEAAPVVAANALEDNVPGSVGPPLLGIAIKLTSESELLVHSPSIMKGYWKDDAETARTLDAGGWLSTGDIAEMRGGRIFIRGRLKEMIVLSIGEKINPNVVEAEIAHDPLFEQVAVVGDGRPFLVALIALNRAVWKRYVTDNGLPPDRPNDPKCTANVLARIAALLLALPHFSQVRAVHLTLEPWTIEAGLLTPTLKVKRDVLQDRFAKEIEVLYAAHRQNGTKARQTHL